MRALWYSKTVRRILLAAAALALALLLVAVLGHTRGSGDTLTSRQDRLDYLLALGWQVDADSEQRQEILLPREFDAVLQDYNALQKQQGFDLERYAGQSATLYSYRVTSWPDKEATVIAELYCHKGLVIAGDVHSTALDGFMLGLK